MGEGGWGPKDVDNDKGCSVGRAVLKSGGKPSHSKTSRFTIITREGIIAGSGFCSPLRPEHRARRGRNVSVL